MTVGSTYRTLSGVARARESVKRVFFVFGPGPGRPRSNPAKIARPGRARREAQAQGGRQAPVYSSSGGMPASLNV